MRYYSGSKSTIGCGGADGGGTGLIGSTLLFYHQEGQLENKQLNLRHRPDQQINIE